MPGTELPLPGDKKRRTAWKDLKNKHARHVEAAQALPAAALPAAAVPAAPDPAAAPAATMPAASPLAAAAAPAAATNPDEREALRALRRECLEGGVEYSISDTIDELRTKLTEKLTEAELAAQPTAPAPSPAPPPAPDPTVEPSPHALPAAPTLVMDARGRPRAFPQTKPEGAAYGWTCSSCRRAAFAQAWFACEQPHIAECQFCSGWLCESCAEAEQHVSDSFVRPCSGCREQAEPLHPCRRWRVQPQPPAVVVSAPGLGPRPPNLLPGLEWPPPAELAYRFAAPTACGKYSMSAEAAPLRPAPLVLMSQWNDDCE